MKRGNTILLVMTFCFFNGFSFATVKVSHITGDVKVRRGLDEGWQRAGVGMLLEDIDSILSGEVSRVVLELPEGVVFTLGGNAVIDIGDLRKITERDLFLYLTSQKINRIERSGKESKIHIENVSVVRGEKKMSTLSEVYSKPSSHMREQETNGAKALYSQGFYPNTIIKLYKIIEKYPTAEDDGEIHLFLGQSFEKVDEPGRALEAYQKVLKQAEKGDNESKRIVQQASAAIQRLKEFQD